MSTEEIGQLSFIIHSEAWYAEAVGNGGNDGMTEEIGIECVSSGGGSYWECAMRWYQLDREPSAKLEAFHDGSWRGLMDSGVMAALAALDGANPSPAEVVALLLGLGFVDVTPRVSPYAREEAGA